jgi:phage FluMu protein Com
MNLRMRCPRCGHGVAWWRSLGFLRFLSIGCPRCHSVLAIDDRGRAAIVGSIAVALVPAVFVESATDSATAVGLTIIAGVLAGCLVATRVGRLVVSPEDPALQDQTR